MDRTKFFGDKKKAQPKKKEEPKKKRAKVEPGSRGVYCGNQKKAPSGKVVGTPSECYKIGRRSGFAGGIESGVKEGTGRQIRRSIISKEVRSKAPRDFKKMSKDMVRDEARKKGVKNYSKMSKDDLVTRVATAKELRMYRS